MNSGAAIALSYDADKLLTGAGDLTITRNPETGLISDTALASVTDSWAYNEFGEPTNYRAAFGASPLYAVQFTRDAAGRITGKTETMGGVTSDHAYTYDAAGRLTGVTLNGLTNAVYDYDRNGNRLSVVSDGTTRHGAYDDQDRLLSLGATTYTWTANGDLESKSTGGQTTRYHYDVLGNLLRVILPAGPPIEYLIDGRNRRVGKRVNGTLVQGFLYDGALRPIAELDEAGKVVSEFVHGTRENVPEYLIKGGQAYRLLCDPLGSPRLVVSVATGQIAQRMDYDAFGRVMADTAPGFQPFGFAGGLYDHDTGLVRFGERDYDAESGRWTAKDPILFAGGQANLYAYVGNDPINRLDPTGLQQNFCAPYTPGPTPKERKELEEFNKRREKARKEDAKRKHNPLPFGSDEEDHLEDLEIQR